MENIISVIKSSGINSSNYAKNTYLLKQSHQVTALLFCIDANLTVSYINENGNEFILKIEDHYTGFLGEMEFFQENNCSLFSVKSNKPGTLFKISKEQYQRILAADSEVFSKLMELMTKRYNRNMKGLIENLTQPTKTSITNQILQAHNLANGDEFKLSSTLNAKKLGITSRTYRRIIQELVNEGMLTKSGSLYQVINQNFTQPEHS